MKIEEKRETVIRVIKDKEMPREEDTTVVDAEKLASKRKRRKLSE